jgi:hypothetical protein
MQVEGWLGAFANDDKTMGDDNNRETLSGRPQRFLSPFFALALKGFLAYSGACFWFFWLDRIGGVVGEVCPGHGWHHIHMIMSTMYLNISLLSIILKLYCVSV